MNGRIDKFGRKHRRVESWPSGVFLKLQDGDYNAGYRQFINVGEPTTGGHLVTVDYFSTRRFNFENKQARAVGDPEEDQDAVNKQYVDHQCRKITESMQNEVLKTVRTEIRRMMNSVVGTQLEERSNDEDFEDECNLTSLIQKTVLQLRCAITFQFFGNTDLTKSKHFYVINYDMPLIGIIFDCKVIYAWMNPTEVTTSVMERGSLSFHFQVNSPAQLVNKSLPSGTTIQFALKPGVNSISGTFVFEYQPWMLDDKIKLHNSYFRYIE